MATKKQTKSKTTSRRVGRPSSYTQEKADLICELLAEGKSLRSVLRDNPDLPDMKTIFKWMREHEIFLQQYARAKQEAADAMAEEILEIADDDSKDKVEGKSDMGVIMRSRVRIDTRKWLMSKMKPKKYGDKLDLTTEGKALPTPILGDLVKGKEK